MIHILIIIAWIICGIICFGFQITYVNMRWPTVVDWTDYVFSFLMSLTGPVGLLTCFITKSWEYGWSLTPWRKRKYQYVLDRLDRK